MPTVMKTREKHPGSCRKNDVFTPKIKDSSTCRIHVGTHFITKVPTNFSGKIRDDIMKGATADMVIDAYLGNTVWNMPSV